MSPESPASNCLISDAAAVKEQRGYGSCLFIAWPIAIMGARSRFLGPAPQISLAGSLIGTNRASYGVVPSLPGTRTYKASDGRSVSMRNNPALNTSIIQLANINAHFFEDLHTHSASPLGLSRILFDCRTPQSTISCTVR